MGFGAEGIRDNYQNYNNRVDLLYSVFQWFGLITGVEGEASNELHPKDFKLLGAYPNPFNSTITIEFYLPKRSKVVAEIYDLLGRRIKTLADEDYSQGEHLLRWDGSNENGFTVSSGIYYLKIGSKNNIITAKLILIK